MEPTQESMHGQPSAPAGLHPLARTRRGFLGAVLAAFGSALIVGIVWLLSRGAPSAGRDPAWPPDPES